MQRNLVHVFVTVFGIYRNANLFTYNFQLVNGGGAVDVACYKKRILMLSGFKHIGKLAAERGFTRTLQPRHQHHGGPALQFQLHGLATHQLCQLVVNDFNHQLPGLNGRKNIHAKGLLLYRISERFGNLKVNIRVKQRATYILQGFRYVDFGDFSLTFQYLKRTFKPVA